MKKIFFATTAVVTSMLLILQAADEAPLQPFIHINEDIESLEITRTPNTTCSAISRDNIEQHLRTMAQSYLSFTEHIPTPIANSVQEKINQTITHVTTMLAIEMTKNNLPSIDKKQIEVPLKAQLRSIAKQLPHAYVAGQNITKRVDVLIAQFFENHHRKLGHIPREMKVEFSNRRGGILSHLTSLMRERKASNISKKELKAIIKTTFEGFIQRMRFVHQQKWAHALLAFINESPESSENCSHIPYNPEAAKLRELVGK